ncbi:TPA: restriction endonuclease [Vibrio vulnificus]
MNDLRTINIPKVTDGEKFELLCRDLFKNDSNYEFVELNGRKGQSQQGVDVFAREITSNNWIGVQCKCRSTGKQLSKSDIEAEVNKAKGFNPSISKLFLYTTTDRDVKVQEIIREYNTNENLDFSVEVKFWNDIEESLKESHNFSIYYRYYSKFFADSLTLGHAVSKLFNLDLCFDERVDTHYELMLGKIPNYKEKPSFNADYYRGTYFFVNLTQNRFETFTTPCYESDLLEVFPNEIDRYRICKWLSSHEDLEDFIASESSSFVYSITTEERIAYMQQE